MLYIILLALGVLSAAGQSKASVVMCNSFSCGYNKRARCTRQKIAIYDNTILGICLYHTQMMADRVTKPMNKGIVVERGKPNLQMIGKIMKAQEEIKDSELLKDSKSFARWMRKQDIGRNEK